MPQFVRNKVCGCRLRVLHYEFSCDTNKVHVIAINRLDNYYFMLYDIAYWHCDGSYVVTKSEETCYMGRLRGTVYDDGYDWKEYGVSTNQVLSLGLELPE